MFTKAMGQMNIRRKCHRHSPLLLQTGACADPEAVRGPDEVGGFFSNTGPNPTENNKGTKPAFIVGLSSFKWRFAGGPTMARF